MSDVRQVLLEKGIVDSGDLEDAETEAREGGEPLLAVLRRKGLLSEERWKELFLRSVQLTGIESILVDMGALEAEVLEGARREVAHKPVSLLAHLLKKGLVSESAHARALARQYGLPFLELDEYEVDDALFRQFDIRLMRRHNFLPHAMDGRELTILASNPADITLLDDLETQLDKNIHLVVGTASEIRRLLNLMEETSLDSEVLFSDLPMVHDLVLESADEAAAETVELQTREALQSPVIKLVDSIVLKGVRKKASDIHFEPYEDELKVKYRIDGVLFEVASLDRRYQNPLVSRVKILSDLDIAQKLRPQDGRFRMPIDDREVDFRVSILPSVFGETVVLRVLDKTAVGLDLAKIGFSEEDRLRFRKGIIRPYGMVLVAGPTGSGKTTTLYSALNQINSREDKVMTVEDPVEYQLYDVVQIPVNERKGLTFATGLRSIVRQDPDKILVGEIRDEETAQIAVNAALTGHLVLSSIHANNVLDAVSRLIGMGIDPYEFVSSFNLIMAQRLVRRICENCREEASPPDESERALMDDYEEHAKAALFHGKGCRFCHRTGYSGRVGIFEIMLLSDRIKQMILDRESPIKTRTQAMEEGMKSLRQSGWEKVLSGQTTIQELNRVTF